MAFYRICPKCGAHLGPGERCNCEETAEKEKKAREQLFFIENSTNQLAFNLPLERTEA